MFFAVNRLGLSIIIAFVDSGEFVDYEYEQWVTVALSETNYVLSFSHVWSNYLLLLIECNWRKSSVGQRSILDLFNWDFSHYSVCKITHEF